MQGVALADLNTAFGHLLVVDLDVFEFLDVLFDSPQADEFVEFAFGPFQDFAGFLALLSLAQIGHAGT